MWLLLVRVQQPSHNYLSDFNACRIIYSSLVRTQRPLLAPDVTHWKLNWKKKGLNPSRIDWRAACFLGEWNCFFWRQIHWAATRKPDADRRIQWDLHLVGLCPNCMTQGQDRCSKPIFFTELTKKKKKGRESKRSCSRDRGTGFLSSASFSNWSWLRPGKMSGAHRTREITPFLLSSAVTQAKAFSKEVQPTRRYLSL